MVAIVTKHFKVYNNVYVCGW